jgi:putative membrane protein
MVRMMAFPWLLACLLFLLAVVALVALLIWVIRSSSSANRTAGTVPVARAAPSVPDQPAAAGTSRALDILRERYARGEITKEQFDAMRQDILS